VSAPGWRVKSAPGWRVKTKALFRLFKISKILQDSPSRQIFGRMYGALNVGKKNN
jgi:hypothetical protein